ncbi:MarR family winged helix-turn-helix transcriptional regulator [Nocardia cyriacigeorgica]|uniref:MarR family transcriptional regulator n=1 Tax=Nocardia cyriacigeorgica TaxID=135487 RepID=A0A5R8NQA9_9NOCA|nr:MarR family transcriptional regulator [Nocardia cyriacigeorgica]TLF77664.1 MarR family transcriptional regulator [Nocardia cyriacigeorgica]
MNGSAARQQDQVTERLRAYGATYREFSRRFAAFLGLHSTDAEALIEILSAEEHGELLSPARLSERIGLSNPATTALLNRLEVAGHVVRTRENRDRRIVTLRSSPEVHTLADDFFGPLGEQVGAVMARYSSDQLEQFDTFLAELLTAMHTQLDQPTPPGTGS